LYCINKDNSITHITKENGLTTNSISQIFQDKTSNIWIGTNGGGLEKLTNNAFTSYDKIKGLNNNSIFGVLEDNSHNLWIATGDDGVYEYDGKATTHYTPKEGLGSTIVRSIAKDGDGSLWFATQNGLSHFKNGKITNYATKNGLSENNTRVLLADNENNIWIGTYGGGLIKYDHKNFTVYTTKDGLSHNYIHSLLQDKNGNIWIGTGNGINRYNKKFGFKSYAGISGVCNPYIGSIAEDKYGQIWFGTDRCIVKYNGLEFQTITDNFGISSNVIYLLYTNSRGNLWIGTNNGLDKITFNSYGQINNIKHYGIVEGFKGGECNSRAVCEDSKHNLWFGTVSGLIKYNPNEDRENVFEPIIHINDVKLFYEKVNWLDYSLDLTYPEYVKYSFKLDGFDKDWTPSTTKTSITYSNLSPGRYSFLVKAKNGDGVWTQTPAEFSFTILPPFWQKWWFELISALLVLYIIFKISSFREHQQLVISKELERKVKERTQLIEKQRDEKEILLKEIHHRVKNNLQVINSLLSIQSGYTKDKNALKLFDEAKNRIRSMALIHEKMYQSGDLASINFKEYILALTNELISTYSVNQDIKLNIDINTVKFNIDTIIPLGLLLNEIISNSLKYAFQKNKIDDEIKISLTKEIDEYTLTIGDNGIGIDHNLLNNNTKSLGMELIKIFVEQLDGTIKLLNEKGTCYEITFKERLSHHP